VLREPYRENPTPARSRKTRLGLFSEKLPEQIFHLAADHLELLVRHVRVEWQSQSCLTSFERVCHARAHPHGEVAEDRLGVNRRVKVACAVRTSVLHAAIFVRRAHATAFRLRCMSVRISCGLFRNKGVSS